MSFGQKNNGCIIAVQMKIFVICLHYPFVFLVKNKIINYVLKKVSLFTRICKWKNGEKAYIYPSLGDAGDRIFGTK